jgi:hypothetical protein
MNKISLSRAVAVEDDNFLTPVHHDQDGLTIDATNFTRYPQRAGPLCHYRKDGKDDAEYGQHKANGDESHDTRLQSKRSTAFASCWLRHSLSYGFLPIRQQILEESFTLKVLRSSFTINPKISTSWIVRLLGGKLIAHQRKKIPRFCTFTYARG